MDILPLDGCPSPGSFARRIQKLLALVFSLFCAQSVPEKHGGMVALGSKLLLTVIPWSALRYRIWRWCEKKMASWNFYTSEYTTELASDPGYMQNEYRQEWFSKAISKPFGQSSIKVPIGYDSYLRMAFGDYLTPPPPSKQKPAHEVAFLDLDTPYATYMKNKKKP